MIPVTDHGPSSTIRLKTVSSAFRRLSIKFQKMATMLRGGTGGAMRGVSFADEWPRAHNTVIALLNQNRVTPAEWQDLFFIVYNIYSWADDGAQLIQAELTRQIERYVGDAERRINVHFEENALLRVYINEWTRFYTQTAILPLPFNVRETYLTQVQILEKRNSHATTTSTNIHTRNAAASVPDAGSGKTVKEVMLETWNSKIFSPIGDKLLKATMRLVESERNGEAFDPQLVIGVRESYVSLNVNTDDPLLVYKTTFEKTFINETHMFYKSRAAQYLEANGVQEYMAYADRKLAEEERRGRRYLHDNADSLNRMLESCVSVLVEEFQDQLLAECPQLIKERHIEKLQMLYRLIKRTRSGIETILQCIDEHIRTEGLNDMKANAAMITTDPEKYVSALLTMFSEFTNLIHEAFYDDARFLTARDKAFREVVNDTSIFSLEIQNSKFKQTRTSVESKCPELLANFCDQLLRKSQLSRRLTSEEIDAKLNNVLLVLKYVKNKDVFMRYHKAHLSRRLILDMSADQEKEEIMVTRLRECGMPAEHVNKLFRMLQDIEINKDLNSQFKRSIGTNNNKNLADMINIKVLNAGAWSRGPERVRVSLPRQLEDFVPEVDAFYKKQHNGRKLTWLHHWSTGTITFGARCGRYDLEVTTFQMAVLFCWDERPHHKFSYESLRTHTELPDTELSRTLFSLVAFPKMRSQLILCDIENVAGPKDFNDSTLFWINYEFQIVKPQQRGRTNLIGRLQLSMEPSAQAEHEEIVTLRRLRVQEAIVQIMKARRTLTAVQLQTELIELLKQMFVPSRTFVKEQIDWLIENQFLQRSADDMNTFLYVA